MGRPGRVERKATEVPPRNKRTLEIEQDLAETIAIHRKRLDLSYEALAERMAAVGCSINPSGIYKTEKSNRRITVEELVAYSEVFGLSVQALLDVGDQAPLDAVWRDLLAAESLQNVLALVQREYEDAANRARKEARTNDEFQRHLQERYDRWAKKFVQEAKSQAARDGTDVSTPELLRAYVDKWDYENAIQRTARDVLGNNFTDPIHKLEAGSDGE